MLALEKTAKNYIENDVFIEFVGSSNKKETEVSTFFLKNFYLRLAEWMSSRIIGDPSSLAFFHFACSYFTEFQNLCKDLYNLQFAQYVPQLQSAIPLWNNFLHLPKAFIKCFST